MSRVANARSVQSGQQAAAQTPTLHDAPLGGDAVGTWWFVSNMGPSELAYGPVSPALSSDYNNYCVGGANGGPELVSPTLDPDLLGKGLLNTANGDPDPLKLQHIIGLVLAQNFPAKAEWERRDCDEKFEIIRNAVDKAFKTVGLPRLKVTRGNLPLDVFGQYRLGSWKMVINRTSLLSTDQILAAIGQNIQGISGPLSRAEVLDLLAHECQHAVQDFLMLSWFSGHTDSELPEYLRAYKALIFLHDIDKFPEYRATSQLRQRSDKHPTRNNAQVQAMMEGIWENFRLVELNQMNPTEENQRAPYRYGLEAEATKAGHMARKCLP